MKKLYSSFLLLSLPFLLLAQAPESFNYQAIVRDASGNEITNQTVGIQISLLQYTIGGSAVYTERFTSETNAYGLISIKIGNGEVQSGTFSAIDWADGPYYIKTEIDDSGGTTYLEMGTSQLLSVPYALHSKRAENVIGGISDVTEVMIGGMPVIDQDGSWVGVPIDETDPVFTAWDKSTGISITESQISDLGTYLETETDPSVPSGTQTGEMQYWDGSEWVVIEAADEGQILSFFNGKPTWRNVVGGTFLKPTDIHNPNTGEIWMDRNLGASQVATSSTDAEAYGDLYQWGRATDGHELRTSSTTEVLSNSDTPGHGDFILTDLNISPRDWRSPQNDKLWQGVNGTNNPCPDGYRLPTEAEWDTERQSWDSDDAAGAFASPLKLPVAGRRIDTDGSLNQVGTNGHYWSSTVNGSYSGSFYFASGGSFFTPQNYRALGHSVRCIRHVF